MPPVLNETQAIGRRFSGLDLTNPHWVSSSAREGISPQIFYDFARIAKMPEKTLAGLLHLSPRTLNEHKGKQKALRPVYSEHLLKLILLYTKGEAVFGSVDEFNYWLNKPFWDSEEMPLQWLITPGGTDLLIAEIEKLAQGYPV